MPYNYILDSGLVSRYSDIIMNSILIFDEAHNVPEASCDGRSFSITSTIFLNFMQEIDKLEYSSYMSHDLRIVSY